MGLSDQEAVEDLSTARANIDDAHTGLEPPLCVAARHRMGEIAKVLLSYRADAEARGHPTGPDSEAAPTAAELAAEDGALSQLIEPISAGGRVLLTLKKQIKSSSIFRTVYAPLSGRGYWYSWEDFGFHFVTVLLRGPQCW